MKRRRGLLVQIGGSGKGCGKTTLIVKLLTVFPGAACIKSALHTEETSGGGDQGRYLAAGAGWTCMISRADTVRLVNQVRRRLDAGDLVFLERNSRCEELAPDIYVFVEADVVNPRQDAGTLRQSADWIVSGEHAHVSKLAAAVKKLWQI
ncbi:MAG TPA: hypothetical protein PLV45_03210 [bacterium]|nr:hypothetical protein [bacterium]